MAIAAEKAVRAGAGADRARPAARRRAPGPRGRQEAAQRRFHHVDPRGGAADRLRHGGGRHRQDGRHAPGRRRRRQSADLFRGGLDNRAGGRPCHRQSVATGRRAAHRPGVAGREGGRQLCHQRQIADHRRLLDEDDPGEFGWRCRAGRPAAHPGDGDPVRLRAVPYGRARPAPRHGHRRCHARAVRRRPHRHDVAPLAAFGAIAFTIGKFGFGILASLGHLVASVYLTSILFVLIGFGGIAWLFGLPLLKIMRYFKDELLIAFTATSGEAMIPRSIVKLRRMGCAEETVGLVLPTGFSFNTDGTAIYMTMAVLFIAQALDIPLTLEQQLMMLFVMLFTSKGAAGVAGAGFVALAATLPALGILPAAGLTLLLGVERCMSEIRAVTNLFSNIFATVVISKWMGELHKECLDRRS